MCDLVGDVAGMTLDQASSSSSPLTSQSLSESTRASPTSSSSTGFTDQSAHEDTNLDAFDERVEFERLELLYDEHSWLTTRMRKLLNTGSCLDTSIGCGSSSTISSEATGLGHDLTLVEYSMNERQDLLRMPSMRSELMMNEDKRLIHNEKIYTIRCHLSEIGGRLYRMEEAQKRCGKDGAGLVQIDRLKREEMVLERRKDEIREDMRKSKRELAHVKDLPNTLRKDLFMKIRSLLEEEEKTLSEEVTALQMSLDKTEADLARIAEERKRLMETPFTSHRGKDCSIQSRLIIEQSSRSGEVKLEQGKIDILLSRLHSRFMSSSETTSEDFFKMVREMEEVEIRDEGEEAERVSRSSEERVAVPEKDEAMRQESSVQTDAEEVEVLVRKGLSLEEAQKAIDSASGDSEMEDEPVRSDASSQTLIDSQANDLSDKDKQMALELDLIHKGMEEAKVSFEKLKTILDETSNTPAFDQFRSELTTLAPDQGRESSLPAQFDVMKRSFEICTKYIADQHSTSQSPSTPEEEEVEQEPTLLSIARKLYLSIDAPTSTNSQLIPTSSQMVPRTSSSSPPSSSSTDVEFVDLIKGSVIDLCSDDSSDNIPMSKGSLAVRLPIQLESRGDLSFCTLDKASLELLEPNEKINDDIVNFVAAQHLQRYRDIFQLGHTKRSFTYIDTSMWTLMSPETQEECNLTAAEKQANLERVIDMHPRIFKQKDLIMFPCIKQHYYFAVIRNVRKCLIQDKDGCRSARESHRVISKNSAELAEGLQRECYVLIFDSLWHKADAAIRHTTVFDALKRFMFHAAQKRYGKRAPVKVEDVNIQWHRVMVPSQQEKNDCGPCALRYARHYLSNVDYCIETVIPRGIKDDDFFSPSTISLARPEVKGLVGSILSKETTPSLSLNNHDVKIVNQLPFKRKLDGVARSQLRDLSRKSWMSRAILMKDMKRARLSWKPRDKMLTHLGRRGITRSGRRIRKPIKA